MPAVSLIASFWTFLPELLISTLADTAKFLFLDMKNHSLNLTFVAKSNLKTTVDPLETAFTASYQGTPSTATPPTGTDLAGIDGYLSDGESWWRWARVFVGHLGEKVWGKRGNGGKMSFLGRVVSFLLGRVIA
ncbi:unnamed protein product [Fraxinus pennsylvanica]|uniref:Uncharacterized protein n=1 Tax=Fraxinus pennsylvanica TaxID=56036 RepID=A0AAD2DMZ2_9LAMI|nr:unnamed protein product [Fraxinus pennsylvanica]